MLCFRPQVQGQEHRTARNSPDMSKSVSSGKALPKTPLKSCKNTSAVSPAKSLLMHSNTSKT